MQKWKKPIGWALTVVGCLAVLLGIWAIGGYIWGVISVWDEPDQSWMFWGLVILFIGIGGLVFGVGLILAGLSLRKSS